VIEYRGVLRDPSTQRKGARWSTAGRVPQTSSAAAQSDVHTGATAARVIFDRKGATVWNSRALVPRASPPGVKCVVRRSDQQTTALMLSGTAIADQLPEHGVDVVGRRSGCRQHT